MAVVDKNNVKLVIDQGSTFFMSILLQDSLDVPIDLTPYTARMQVRKNYTTIDKLVDVTSVFVAGVGQITKPTPLEGEWIVTILKEATVTIPAGRWVWDFEVTHTDGTTVRVLGGPCEVSPEVTR